MVVVRLPTKPGALCEAALGRVKRLLSGTTETAAVGLVDPGFQHFEGLLVGVVRYGGAVALDWMPRVVSSVRSIVTVSVYVGAPD